MVHYLYHFDYKIQLQHNPSCSDGPETDGDETDVNEAACGILVTHAEVYALAGKYLIRGLKDLALQQFKTAAAASLDIDDFLLAASVLYESTSENDKGLRDIVVETLSPEFFVAGHGESAKCRQRFGIFEL